MKVCPECSAQLNDQDVTCSCGASLREKNPKGFLSKWKKFLNYHQFNAKYSALFVIAIILDLFAFISLFFIIFGVIKGLKSNSLMMIAINVLVSVGSFLLLKAMAETIILFIDIEENTCKTNDLLLKILETARNSSTEETDQPKKRRGFFGFF